jgi:carbohydrate-selective porin OprB
MWVEQFFATMPFGSKLAKLMQMVSLKNGTGGWYWLLEQQLYRECGCHDDDGQGLGMFVQFGQADPDVSEVGLHLGGGMAWQGLLPTRDDDSLGVGVSWVEFSDAAGLAYRIGNCWRIVLQNHADQVGGVDT